ncbi:MAG TPA: flagellar hook-associated protein FlgL, partial [Treponemataceae bacterium]|nr:flagellar hook-associated protein FlgL [Treponemataceae bacterium]
MRRVSSGQANVDVQNNLRRQERNLNKVNNQLGSQQRIQSLRDDPIAAGHLVRYQSYAKRIEQFKHNAETISDQFILSEGYVDHSLQIMHRLRELAVTGAHGVYNKDDLANMAAEVDELLKEIIQNANALDADGNALFAGERSKNQAFIVDKGNTTGSDSELIQRVRYNGSIKQNEVEVDEHAYMSVNRSGNQIFWAESQQLIAQRDATSYTVLEDAVVSINGTDISLKTGDSIHGIIAKINNSGAPVKASLDPMSNALMLHTTDSRQLWLEDIDGNAFEDLGLIKDKSQRPPYNLNDSV